MADRSIMTILKLNVQDFKRGVQEASSSLEQVLQKADKNNRVADTTFGKLQQSARYQKQEWTQVGTTLLGIGAGMSAVGASIAKTGIEYNTLQQKSRAALSTMLGSADAAKTQLAALDAFVKQSPFSKQTFLQAQQQMIAFGIETKKVIPYLSAVQDAVAAAGGGNQQLSEIVTIMAKIKSSAKITATDLMQFGNHGIDAATLIGVAMGKTGAQIKEEITAGTLGADEALDALAEGMATKFDGAAAGIKNTMEGAWDRLGSAWRDLSAEIMKPLVSPDGGGFLVDAVNGAADFLRMIESLPGPVQAAIGVVGGLATAGTLLGGGFLVLAPRIFDTMEAIRSLRDTFPLLDSALSRTTGLIGKLGKALGVAGAVAAGLKLGDAISENFHAATPEIESVTRALLDFEKSGSSLDEAFAKVGAATQIDGTGVRDLADAIDLMVNPSLMQRLDQQAAQILSLGSSSMSNEMEDVAKQFDAIGQALAGLVESGNADRAAAIFEQLSAQWVAAGGDIEDLRDLMPAYQAALDGVANSAELTGEATGGLAESAEAAAQAITDQAEATIALMDTQNEYANTILSLRDAERGWVETLEQANATIAANGESLDLNTESGRANQAALDDVATAGWKLVESMASATDANGAAKYSTEQVQAAMQTARDQFVNAAIAAGYEADEANRLADELGLIPTNVTSKVEVQSNAEQRVQEIQAALDGIRDRVVTVTTQFVEMFSGGSGSTGGKYTGGWVPGLAAGGWVPGSRAGYDNVLWPLKTRSGQVLSQPLEGQEFVVNSLAASRNAPLLEAINSGADLRGLMGGGAVGASSLPAPVVQYSRVGASDPVQVHVTARLSDDQVKLLAESMEFGARRVAREWVNV